MAEIKSKISGLRAQLGRELNKSSTKRSSQGANENYSSTWERLHFLVPLIQAGKSLDNLTCSTDQPTLKKLDQDNFADTETNTIDESPSKSPISTKPIATTARSGGEGKNEVEFWRQELLSTCIQVLKEPMP